MLPTEIYYDSVLCGKVISYIIKLQPPTIG
jgi:hypothetical protein